MGIAEAQSQIGSFYYFGKGVIQDYIEAYAWTSLSSVNGDETSKKNRDLIAKELSPEGLEKGQARAKELYDQINKEIENKSR